MMRPDLHLHTTASDGNTIVSGTIYSEGNVTITRGSLTATGGSGHYYGEGIDGAVSLSWSSPLRLSTRCHT